MQAIISTSANWCLGASNAVPWFDHEESRRFTSLTVGATLVMGRKTYEARFPWMRGHRLVVLSRQDIQLKDAGVYRDPAVIAASHPDAWVVGGAETLSAMLPHLQYLYLTRFPHVFHGTVWTPEIQWALWATRASNRSLGRELTILERRPLAKTSTKPSTHDARSRQRDEAKVAS